ncbi:MAG: hypothetical protein KDA38_02640 [Planctomycetales bacterium]|nr:hypothetical protein [Planctomycetales bacterium]
MFERIRTTCLLGSAEHEELRPTRDFLLARTHCEVAATVGQALEFVRRSSPELIVVAKPRRGGVSQADVERLRRAAPLAHLVSVVGSWCEGETRSGEPLLGTERIAWHQATGRLKAWLRTNVSANRPAPLTATPAERALWEADRSLAEGQGTVVIRARSFDEYETWADPCVSAGYGAVWDSERHPAWVRNVAAVIWIGGGGLAAEADTVQSLVRRCGDVPLLTLLSFPRHDDVDLARACGASLVLGKPISNHDFLNELAVMLESSRSRETTRRMAG